MLDPQASPITSKTLVVIQFVVLASLAYLLPQAAWSSASITPVLLGLWIGAWALSVNRPGNFNIRPEPKEGGRLIDSGPYRWIRHPMYAALLLCAAGIAIAVPDSRAGWLAVLLAVVLHAKMYLEEPWMRARHPDYERCSRRTRRLIPYLW